MTKEDLDKNKLSLTNRDIAKNYNEIEFCALPSEFLGAFAYWVVAQNPNDELINLAPPLRAFNVHVLSFFDNPEMPIKLNFEKLKEIINDTVFENIPEILELNKLEPDFIDIGALARNIFFMILREHITQD